MMQLTTLVIPSFLAAMVLGFVQPAEAFTKGACRKDEARLCGSQQGPARNECMKRHQAELSPACQENIREMKANGAKFQKACSGDLRHYCSDVKPGDGRLVACLHAHQPQLSPACAAEIAPKKH